jgi:uroporphyrinogen-III decarboxylase
MTWGVMDRRFYVNLAAQGLRMPIGADLVLSEQAAPEAVRLDPFELGRVVEQTARRFRTPLAFPLMDLRLEKASLLLAVGVTQPNPDGFHFTEPPPADLASVIASTPHQLLPAAAQASLGALRYIAGRTALLPVGMAIGPFSLMTKLIADPITPVALAGRGLTASDDATILLAERCLSLAEAAIRRAILAQAAAGARAIVICEPAASTVYLSPRQLREGAAVFQTFVMAPNLRLRSLLDQLSVDLIFHDCGELLPEMVSRFAAELHPVILSLGSSRRLWEDARLVPPDVVLFGNLPTKSFYSDTAMPDDEVRRRTAELLVAMRACGHPHILGSECDVLHVPEAGAAIRRKVDIMLSHAA